MSTIHVQRAEDYLLAAEQRAANDGLDPVGSSRALPCIGVVGTGTMGIGIAAAAADAGADVLLSGRTLDGTQRAIAAVYRRYEAAVSKGRLSADDACMRMSRVTPCSSYADFARAQMVIEAILEDIEAKNAVIAALTAATPENTLLASTTSSLDIDDIARACSRSWAFLGFHFFNPADRMRLVEIVVGRKTSDETIVGARMLARRLQKVGVVVRNGVGFVANRMLSYYRREAGQLLEQGATVRQVDAAMRAFGMPMGPFEAQDLTGLDVDAQVRRYLSQRGLQRADGPQSPLPQQLVELGRLGQKTGAGWYRYHAGERTPIDDPIVLDLVRQTARRPSGEAIPTDDEIVNRITAVLVNEGARILYEQVAQRAGDIDAIICNGLGFPRRRGGPMFYAETIGLGRVVERIRAYECRLGRHWAPAPLLIEAADRGGFSALSPGL